jgi:glycosyltransferase involved in cell wall biosynthesis
MLKVSVIITTHNRPHLLSRAVESARGASSGPVEVVVVDDASGEETARVCRGLKEIRYVRVESNLGVAGARNRGILASRGEYLSFLDDDDVRLEGSLDGQIEALDSAPDAGFVYGQAILGMEDGSPTEDFYPARCPAGDVFWELLSQNFVPCGTVVFRRSCLDRVGLLDTGIPGIDDWDLWVRVAEFYPVLSQERPLMIWRKSTPDSGQGTSDAARMVELSVRRFRDYWLALSRVRQAPARRRREVSRRFSFNMARHLLWEAVRSLAAGQSRRSRKNLLAALRLCPSGVARVLVHPRSFRSLLTRAPKERRALKAGAHRLSRRKAGSGT